MRSATRYFFGPLTFVPISLGTFPRGPFFLIGQSKAQPVIRVGGPAEAGARVVNLLDTILLARGLSPL